MRLGSSARRLRAVLLLSAVVLSLFAGRLVELQGLQAPAYAQAAQAERIRYRTLPATRGDITDVHGVALATSVDAVDVTADQTLVVDPAATARALAPLLRAPLAPLTARLTGGARYVVVARRVEPEVWRRVQALELPGLFSERSSRRVYPAGSVAANLVGFTGADGTGLAGLEYGLDAELAGRPGRRVVETAAGRAIPTGLTAERAAVPGEDVRLTIDRDVQWFAEQAVAAKVAETGAQSGTVVVMDPRTGALLAVATAPRADPATRRSDARTSSALTEAYEPGSTGKVITASALIEQHAVTPATRFTVPNRLSRAGSRFKDWEEHGTLRLTYAGTLARSSNIGTILAAERLGTERIAPYFARFGLGRPTGLGFPGETAGAVLPVDRWSATTGYTMTFGQGYSVSTVQMASVFATIANDGVRVPPRLVASTTRPDGTVVPNEPAAGTRAVSAATARTVRTMLEAVVRKGGTAPKAAIPGYRVAGKTGTAQRYDGGCGCYRGFTMSFLGMAPADAPRLVVAVTLQDVKRGIGGGSTAGPVFRDVMAFALQTLRVPPTGTVAPAVPLTWGPRPAPGPGR